MKVVYDVIGKDLERRFEEYQDALNYIKENSASAVLATINTRDGEFASIKYEYFENGVLFSDGLDDFEDELEDEDYFNEFGYDDDVPDYDDNDVPHDEE